MRGIDAARRATVAATGVRRRRTLAQQLAPTRRRTVDAADTKNSANPVAGSAELWEIANVAINVGENEHSLFTVVLTVSCEDDHLDIYISSCTFYEVDISRQ